MSHWRALTTFGSMTCCCIFRNKLGAAGAFLDKMYPMVRIQFSTMAGHKLTGMTGQVTSRTIIQAVVVEIRYKGRHWVNTIII